MGAFFFEKHSNMRQLSDEQCLTLAEGSPEVQPPSLTIFGGAFPTRSVQWLSLNPQGLLCLQKKAGRGLDERR